MFVVTNQGEMKMEKYFEINKSNQNIRCKLYYSKQHPIEKVVLFGHGFAGHKDNGAAQKFADRVLSKYKGIAVLIFSLFIKGQKSLLSKLFLNNVPFLKHCIKVRFKNGN